MMLARFRLPSLDEIHQPGWACRVPGQGDVVLEGLAAELGHIGPINRIGGDREWWRNPRRLVRDTSLRYQPCALGISPTMRSTVAQGCLKSSPLRLRVFRFCHASKPSRNKRSEGTALAPNSSLHRGDRIIARGLGGGGDIDDARERTR